MLERFFGPRANERLIEINVMERGIRAYFEFIERPFPEVAAKMEAKKA